MLNIKLSQPKPGMYLVEVEIDGANVIDYQIYTDNYLDVFERLEDILKCSEECRAEMRKVGGITIL